MSYYLAILCCLSPLRPSKCYSAGCHKGLVSRPGVFENPETKLEIWPIHVSDDKVMSIVQRDLMAD